ncbi:GPR1/FUN34/yaaH family-domain-containing protein [Umbelopsis sp. PMI_123]|nr:GPR1/FUN34/yaaH family-domain-containing protein [Umbelopsis sp. PMI_123]
MSSGYYPGTLQDSNSIETINEKHPHDLEKGPTQVNTVKRTMGNPSVLGLWSFGMVTILLGTYNLFLPFTSNHIIFPSAFMFGGLAQFIAGFMDFWYGGTFGGTVFVSYGGFWFGNGLMMLSQFSSTLDSYTNKTDLDTANGIYHIYWAAYTAFLFCISLKVRGGNFLLNFCLGFVGITLFLEALFHFTQVVVLRRISGVTAFIAAIGAYYKGLAELMEEQDVNMWMGPKH